ncbi:DNA translocase FtsK [Nonomuraea sp. NPDC005650]|uniref:DNA translocase FtsK n=1 Tax=Nonomuraea sp. NPDC005650 TaxID=3157045 RepID=UPI0033ABEBB3
MRLLTDAVTMVVRQQTVSASTFQRKFHVGFATAARLLQRLEELGVVGPHHSRGPRQVLTKPDGLPALLATITGSEPPND